MGVFPSHNFLPLASACKGRIPVILDADLLPRFGSSEHPVSLALFGHSDNASCVLALLCLHGSLRPAPRGFDFEFSEDQWALGQVCHTGCYEGIPKGTFSQSLFPLLCHQPRPRKQSLHGHTQALAVC